MQVSRFQRVQPQLCDGALSAHQDRRGGARHGRFWARRAAPARSARVGTPRSSGGTLARLGPMGGASALTTATQEASTPTFARGTRLRDASWALVFLLAAASLQGVQTVPFDGDTAYHVAVARLIAKHGVLRQFPWTPFSYLAERYADKELFFHFLLVPLSHLSYSLAAKLVGTLLGAALLWTFYRILCYEQVECPGLWTLAMLVSSGGFIVRLALVRPHLLSITLLLAIVWAAIHRKWMWLGLLSFLYPFCYIAWHAVLMVLLIVEGARLVAQRKIAVRTLAISACAMTAAVLLHPNFPANTQLFWIQNVEVLVRKAWGGEAGFSLGEEFAPLGFEAMLRHLSFPLIVVGMALFPAVRRRRESLAGFAFLACAIAFIGLTAKTQRFLEYAVPFSFLAGATSLRAVRKPLLVPLIAVMSAWTLLVGSHRLRDLPLRQDLFPRDRAESIQKIVPEGAQVFTCGWETTGEMMLALPERRFLVALDPVFFWEKDAELYRTWFDVVHHPPTDPVSIVKSRFQAGFILCEASPEYVAFIQRVNESPGMSRAFRLGPWALFVLKESS